MEILLRMEQENDYKEVENVTREAFWNHYAPGCDEHFLAHILRETPVFVKELDYVAVYQNKIIGNIMYTEADILLDNGTKYPVLCFGPLSVLPEYQGKGVGSRLVRKTKEIAKNLGYKAILISGDPIFYEKVGFQPAENYRIGTQDDTYVPALLACELTEGALRGCGGKFIEDAVYKMDQAKAEEFDKCFPPKEKITGGAAQERFQELTSISRPRG